MNRFLSDFSSGDLKLERELSESQNIHLFTFEEDLVRGEDILDRVRKHPSVHLAQFDYVIRQRELIPNDTRFNEMWAMKNTGQSSGIVGEDIKATFAWDLVYGDGNISNSRDIVVAVLDDGFSINHPDLRFHTLRWCTITNSSNIATASHGTHVAGTVGARGNNGQGVIGVGWDDNFYVMPIRMSLMGNTLNSHAIAAYTWVLDRRVEWNTSGGTQGAFVVATSASWGIDGANPANFPVWRALYDTMGEAGILSAGATSNSPSINVDTMGDVPTGFDSPWLISVTNTNRNRQRLGAFGLTTIDLSAPGGDILSTETLTTYSVKTGTSMATPHVAGVIGLMYRAASERLLATWDANPGELALIFRQLIMDGVDLLPSLAGMTVTGGRLNALNPVMAVIEMSIIDGPGFRISPNSHNFGEVYIGSAPATQTFTITNNGTEDLSVENIALTGTDQTHFSIDGNTDLPWTLEPDATNTFSVSFMPSSGGLKSATIEISHNASDTASIVTLSGTGDIVTPGLSYRQINANTSYEVSRGTATSTHIEIPPNHLGLPVTAIAGNGFADFTSMTSISIPNSVTSIGDFAFENCSGLTSITIPNSVTTIGIQAFSGCTSLISINLSNSLTTIGEAMFYNCSALTSITIPSNVTSIGNHAFALCSGLTEVTIPSSVTTIGENAFWNNTGLTTINIPSSVILIGNSAFSGCSNLASVSFASPSSLISISNLIFFGCTSLSSITIPRSVVTIGNSAFSGCTNLVSVTFDAPSSLSSIEEDAFINCIGLTEITIPRNVTTINRNPFVYTPNLENILVESGNTHFRSEGNSLIRNSNNTLISGTKNSVIPLSVNIIGDFAFAGCTDLIEITIPTSVHSISHHAFHSCTNLTNITLPNTITFLGTQAFAHCSSLAQIFIPNSVTTIGNSAFGNCDILTIYAEVLTRPNGWHVDWNPDNRPVVWGHEVSDDDMTEVVIKTALMGNYPNPFNPETTIKFSVGAISTSSVMSHSPQWNSQTSATVSYVRIDVYNIRGQHVKTLVDGYFPSGEHSVVWNGTDDNGQSAGSGVYFYRMIVEDFTSVRQMILLK
jgi:hypothetical protein